MGGENRSSHTAMYDLDIWLLKQNSAYGMAI